LKTPLYTAVENDNYKIAEILLKAGAEILLKAGADIHNETGYFSKSPLHLAMQKNNTNMIKILTADYSAESEVPTESYEDYAAVSLVDELETSDSIFE